MASRRRYHQVTLTTAELIECMAALTVYTTSAKSPRLRNSALAKLKDGLLDGPRLIERERPQSQIARSGE